MEMKYFCTFLAEHIPGGGEAGERQCPSQTGRNIYIEYKHCSYRPSYSELDKHRPASHLPWSLHQTVQWQNYNWQGRTGHRDREDTKRPTSSFIPFTRWMRKKRGINNKSLSVSKEWFWWGFNGPTSSMMTMVYLIDCLTWCLVFIDRLILCHVHEFSGVTSPTKKYLSKISI